MTSLQLQLLFLLCTATISVIASEKCHKTLDSTDSLTTKILLRDECSTSGKMNWLQDENTATAGGPGSDNELMSPTPHIVQFRKAGQQSFTICLTFPDSSSVNRPFTVHQLRGKSRKHIRSSASVSSNSGGELSAISDGNSPVCIESQCSHVSLVLQYQPMIITSDGDQPSIDNTNRQLLPVTPAVEINYQFALDQRCPKCTDQCMKNVFCSSSHMFTGTIVSSELISTDGRGYRSVVKLDRQIKQNNLFTEHSGIKPHPSCNQTTPTSEINQHHNMGVMVTVRSTCYLKLEKRYLISANYRAGLKNKGRLAVSCAQEDVEYGLHVLQKLMSPSDNNQCC